MTTERPSDSGKYQKSMTFKEAAEFARQHGFTLTREGGAKFGLRRPDHEEVTLYDTLFDAALGAATKVRQARHAAP